MRNITYIVPQFTLCYLVYGDNTELQDDEVNAIDTWLKNENIRFLSTHGDYYFSRTNDVPGFGLASDVVECVFEVIE